MASWKFCPHNRSYLFSVSCVWKVAIDLFLSTCSKVLNKLAARRSTYDAFHEKTCISKSKNKKQVFENREQYWYSTVSLITIKKETCIPLVKRRKKTKYFANLNIKDMAGNKESWKTIKPLKIFLTAQNLKLFR